MTRPLVSVVIPVRRNESIVPAADTLMAQSCQDIEILVIVDHADRGQSWARNQGADSARGTYLLFSDSDIRWRRDAVEKLVLALDAAEKRDLREPDAQVWLTGYAYGGFQWTKQGTPLIELGMVDWDVERLKKVNFVSTMSLIRRGLFPGFDEELRRLEDWELWLRMALTRRICGVRVPEVLFTTEVRKGISWANPLTHEAAEAIVRRKHGI